MRTPDIKSATPAEIDRCVAIMVLAFVEDPAARFVFADPQVYFNVFPRFIRAFGGRAFDHGSAHYIDGGAVALWIPPGVQPDEAALMALVEGAVAEQDRDSVFGLFEQMGGYHPHQPHWYLPLIGIDPGGRARVSARRCSPMRSPSAISRRCRLISRRRVHGARGCTSGTASRRSAQSRPAIRRR